MQIHVARGGEQLGVFSPEEVRTRLASGEFRPTDYGWADGQTEWVTLSSFPGLATVPPPMQAGAVPPSLPTRTAAAGRPIAHNEPIPSSGMAITSLIFGILSVTFLPFLASIPAVVFGHIARSKIKQSNGRVGGSGMALAGLIMGYIGVAFFLLAMLAAMALPVFGSIQLKGKQIKSLSQAKQIATACRLYAVDHNGAFPKRLEELVPDYLSDPKILKCPLSPSEPIGYEYYGGKDTDPHTQVLLVGKAVSRGKQRIVVRVDSSGEIAHDMPELPPHSW